MDPIAIKTYERQMKSSMNASSQQALLYSEALALSLIVYAQAHHEFSLYLDKLIEQKLPIKLTTSTFSFPINLEILWPIDITTAKQRAFWLIKNIAENHLPGSTKATALLAAAQQQKLTPRNLIVGIVGVAIPGITLGLIKRRPVTMTVVVRSDMVGKPAFLLAEKIISASFNIFSRSLQMANNEISRLEPEIAEWFYGSRTLSFFAATEKEITRIKQQLSQLGVIHSLIRDEGHAAVLAMSPAVNLSALTTTSTIEPLQNTY